MQLRLKWKEGGEGALRYSTLIMGGNKTFAGLKVPTQCPLVLLVKVAGNKVKRWEVKKVAAGEGLFGLCSRGEEMNMWTGRHRNELSMWTVQHRNELSMWTGQHRNGLSMWTGQHRNELIMRTGRHCNGLSMWTGQHHNRLSMWTGQHHNGLSMWTEQHRNEPLVAPAC